MRGKDRERWEVLCELAANEQNPKKLLELVQEINRLLEAKRKRLRADLPSDSQLDTEISSP
jgi:hypothetical protein